MRRIVDSPVDQDMDGINKALSGKWNVCDICGKEGRGSYWLHCDSWTKWMHYGCGCNVNHCEDCKDAANAKSRELINANRKKAEEAEKEMLKTITAGQLARLRYRYCDDFNCSHEFREWVQSVVGEDRMKEMLDVPCNACGKLLGPTKYTFEDKDGNRSLKTMQEVEDYCYQVLNRDSNTEPFKNMSNWGNAEIKFQTPIWDYYERKGWSHDLSLCDDRNHFNEASQATKGPDCGGSSEWSYGYYIYHMPTKTYLGRYMKRGGDWVQTVKTNRVQLEQEMKELRERFGDDYHKNEAFYPACQAIENKEKWAYYCGKECCEKSTKEHGTMFI